MTVFCSLSPSVLSHLGDLSLASVVFYRPPHMSLGGLEAYSLVSGDVYMIYAPAGGICFNSCSLLSFPPPNESAFGNF
jgi:hypothetical protein